MNAIIPIDLGEAQTFSTSSSVHSMSVEHSASENVPTVAEMGKVKQL